MKVFNILRLIAGIIVVLIMVIGIWSYGTYTIYQPKIKTVKL